MKNKYWDCGDITQIYIWYREDRYTCLIDTEDLPLVSMYSWNLGRDGYSRTNIRKGKQARMHRLILGCEDVLKVVDHINHDILDNRKCNLRIITNTENMQHRQGAASHGKSGVRGVYWNTTNKCWSGRVEINHKPYSLGSFSTIEEATIGVEERRSALYKEHGIAHLL